MTEELMKREDIIITGGLVVPQTFAGLWKLAEIYSKTGLLPKGVDTPERAFLCIQLGQEIGLSPTQALQNIAPINGRATIWGDAMLAVVERSGLMANFTEGYEGEGDKLAAFTTAQRKGRQPSTSYFSIADAKRAGLWGKQGPWTQYPMRMLKMRARGFALRDNFSDVLKGLYAREEMEDVIDIQPVTKTASRPQEQTFSQPATTTPEEPEKSNLGQPDATPATFTPIEQEYLTAMAEKTRLPLAQIQDRANQNRELFAAKAAEWAAKRDAPPDPIARDAWVNLKSSGFSTFVHKNIDAIKAMPDTSEMQLKWSKLYTDEPWPLAPAVKPDPAARAKELLAEVDAAANDGAALDRVKEKVLTDEVISDADRGTIVGMIEQMLHN